MSASLPDFPRLSDSNYNEWKVNMKASLQALGVWHVVIGERVKPAADSPELEKWLQDSDKAAGVLKMRVELGQMTYFESVEDDPKQIWDQLAVFYISKKPALRFNVYAELFGIFKQENESLTSLMVRTDQTILKADCAQPQRNYWTKLGSNQ
jgi:hypothetical protein